MKDMSEINYRETPFKELPLGAILPKGWLRNQLEIQANGLTGHLEEIWESVGIYNGWLGGNGHSWERAPYYLDGMLPLAYLLGDDKLIDKTKKWIEWTLNSQTGEGWFGPEKNNDWWPRMVMLKVLKQYYEVTRDKRVIPFMEGYFRYQIAHLPKRPLEGWGRTRACDNIYVVLWLYGETKESYLLDLVEILYRQSYPWDEHFYNFPHVRPTSYYYPWDLIVKDEFWKKYELMSEFTTHTVNIAMGFKLAPLIYQITGDEYYYRATQRGIDSIMKYHGLAHGMWSGDEHLMGTNPSQGTEFCSVTEFMFSLATMVRTFTDVSYADRLEKLAYNAIPATMNKDMTAHQYDQQPNQVLSSVHRRIFYNNYDEANTFGLEPYFGCCTANMHQGLPKFVKNMWMKTEDHGLVAITYGPCVVKTLVQGVEVTITEETNYPFNDHITFNINSNKAVVFPLKLRIPHWAHGATVTYKGREHQCIAGEYFIVEETFDGKEKIVLHLPMEVRVTNWHNQSIALERGSLLFSLNIGEEWKKYGRTEPFADWEVYPTTDWNYALKQCCLEELLVKEDDMPYQPYDKVNTPVKIYAKAKKLESWKMERYSAQEVPISPVELETGEETIELVPYAATKLRVTCFPYYK
ncbi:beta-L-arabinofuranosidase domain-containing protein [Vallitalea okinawensis]|uniref:beta-L-arabinofuranosidase domain-containing protein n=1 Tax=Vallitalea okinawensis TaxID=2078660 RepID=UPI000CFB82E6|nr:beta-L-arabinofuranosidase domain-containing protein [Vallitalea okinawensis]